MHMIGTNLCIWLNVLVQETKHEIINLRFGHGAHHGEARPLAHTDIDRKECWALICWEMRALNKMFKKSLLVPIIYVMVLRGMFSTYTTKRKVPRMEKSLMYFPYTKMYTDVKVYSIPKAENTLRINLTSKESSIHMKVNPMNCIIKNHSRSSAFT